MPVALFVTCLVDTLSPEVGRATVTLLERLGVEVEFPRAQTCCGQLHLNAGYPELASALARRFLDTFAGYEAIVAYASATGVIDPADFHVENWRLVRAGVPVF